MVVQNYIKHQHLGLRTFIETLIINGMRHSLKTLQQLEVMQVRITQLMYLKWRQPQVTFGEVI